VPLRTVSRFPAVSGAPANDVLAAFGADGPPSRLAGGRADVWVAGGFVFKPLDVGEQELCFQAGLLPTLPQEGFRIAIPRRARGDALIVDGWTCFERLPGEHEERRWADIIEAGRRFHATLRDIPEPAFIRQRTHAWAVGDRVAFGELAPDRIPPVRHLARLLGLCRPIDQPAQLIHGDLTGNVLFSSGAPPGIIDFSPYFRPEPFASAIVVADALVFEGADEHLLTAVSDAPDFTQYLLRALIYRLVTDRVAPPNAPDPTAEDDPYLPAVELAVRLAGGRR
jgi:uncharacterized protein (TIGR02569 family)